MRAEPGDTRGDAREMLAGCWGDARGMPGSHMSYFGIKSSGTGWGRVGRCPGGCPGGCQVHREPWFGVKRWGAG